MTGVNSNYKFIITNALHEWLTKSNGTGYFYVGHWDDIADAFSNTITSGVETGTQLHDVADERIQEQVEDFVYHAVEDVRS